MLEVEAKVTFLQKNKAICLDIGGTFIKYAVIDRDGRISGNGREKTCNTGSEGLIKQVLSIAEKLADMLEKGEIKGIGISSAGQVDHNTGRIIYATDNLPGWTGVELSKIVSKHFGLDCYVENDVNAAALGELYYGNGRGYKDFICITIGTGIGGALVKGGELIHGTAGSAGELGHMIIKAGGRKCNCGNRGCYEQYASVTALKRNVREKLGDGFMPYDTGVEWLLEKYHEDVKVRAILDRYIDYISKGIVSLLHIFNPSAVIIGGAVSTNSILIEGIREAVNKSAMPPFVKGLEILPAHLGNDASMYGAATYVFNDK